MSAIINCIVRGCHKLAKKYGKGYCGMHATRLYRTGDPLGLKRPKYAGVKCSVDSCDSQAQSNHMCEKHAQRMRRYGDVNYITPEKERVKRLREAQPTLRKLKPSTYPKLYGRHEHRVVMESIIGRRLERLEIVHHIDGNKHNNYPDNLQLMSQSEHMKLHHLEGDL